MRGEAEQKDAEARKAGTDTVGAFSTQCVGEKEGRLGRPAPFCFAHLLQVDSLDCHEVAMQSDFAAQ